MRVEVASTTYPTVIQEHALTVRSLEELPEDVQQDIMFKPNFAVQTQLNEAWKELQDF